MGSGQGPGNCGTGGCEGHWGKGLRGWTLRGRREGASQELQQVLGGWGPVPVQESGLEVEAEP